MTTDNPSRVETAREVGTALGILFGQRAAELAAFKDALELAQHAQLDAAGLCICPVAPVSVPVDALLDEAHAQQIIDAALRDQRGTYCSYCSAEADDAGTITHANACPHKPAEAVDFFAQDPDRMRALNDAIHGRRQADLDMAEALKPGGPVLKTFRD